MIQPARIAVVVSTYNRPDFLRLTLEGYARQSDNNFTLYVADDGSGPETAALIAALKQDFPVPIVHLWHEDRGFRKALIHNLTLLRVREPYVLLTDGDCIPHREMVASHRKFARAGCFISGGRILLAEPCTSELCRQQAKLPPNIFVWFNLRLRDQANRIWPLLRTPSISAPNTSLFGIRGCHLSCWRLDLVRVNGFDVAYEGWGREDSDLVTRLLNAGIKRRNLGGAPVLHLWHPEEDRGNLEENNQMLAECQAEGRERAIVGLDQVVEMGSVVLAIPPLAVPLVSLTTGDKT